MTRKSKRWLIALGIFLAFITFGYLLGPKPVKPDFAELTIHSISDDLASLEDSINKTETALPLKPDNEARIIWATPYVKTPVSIVYLHGNAASQEEGDPIHEALAHRYGANLFLARLSGHGLQTNEPMLSIDAEAWMQSALDAIVVGNKIGERVILLTTSTGSTLSLYLASKYPDLVDAQIMMSPNIDLYDPRSSLLTAPWGLYIARQIMGSDYYGWKAPGPARSYWYARYRIEGLCTLKSMIDHTMNEETFSKITDPVLMLYYYRDEDNQDHIVSVDRMKEMFLQLGTSDNLKQAFAIEDAGTHIIGSDIFNPNIQAIWSPIVAFCEEVLHLTPVNQTDWKPFLDRG